MMKKLFTLAAAFLLVSVSRAQAPAKDIDKMVSLTNLEYDMGRIPSHKPVEFNVTIKNISRSAVVLKEVKVGCGCTTPKYRGNESIPPGGSTFITVGFNGDAIGPFEKTVDIYFNDGTVFKQVKFHGVAVQADTTRRSVPVYRK